MGKGVDVKLLLVEDDQESGRALCDALELSEIKVEWVLSAENAVDVFEIDKFDAIVADIRLGGASGVELLREIRKKSTDFPVILLTAYSDIDAAIGAVKLGAQDYIMKPLKDVDALLLPLLKAIKHYKTLLSNEALRKKNEENFEQMKHLGSDLVLAEEHERRKLAVDLHDSVGQLLNASLLRLDLLDIVDNDMKKNLDAARSHLSDAIQRIRTLTFHLSSPVLYICGIRAALSELVEHIKDTYGIEVSYQSHADDSGLPDDCKVLLYRTVRELLINVVKHAEASAVVLSVRRDHDNFVIVVKDNGKGFMADPLNRWEKGTMGLGLFSIRDRLCALGGSFKIISEQGRGTEVVVSVPVVVDTERS